MIGTMLVEQIKYGLIIAMAELDINAEEYLKMVNKQGYHLKYIDSKSILNDLSPIRQKQLDHLITAK